jgi:hypothetical protein
MINGRSVADIEADRSVFDRFSAYRTKPGHA